MDENKQQQTCHDKDIRRYLLEPAKSEEEELWKNQR